MHLKIQKRNGREYLSVVQSYRRGGKPRQRTVETIGYADAFADRYPDPVSHFRAYVAELNEREKAAVHPVEISFDAHALIDEPGTPPARLGAALALGCLDAVGVADFFHARAGRPRMPAQAGRIFEMLATERMMHAASKRETWTARASFPRSNHASFEDVYAALPSFAYYAKQLDECHLKSWKRLGGEPNANRMYLICGSYAFPVDGGSERAGIAVAIGQDNMPLGYHVVKGRFEPRSFREASEALKERLGVRRSVVVAGGLRELEPTIAALSAIGDGFVLYQRDFEKVPDLVDWAHDGADYQELAGGVQAKARASTRTLPDGKQIPLREIVLSGGGYAVRQRYAVLVTSELDLSVASVVQLYRELWRQAEPFQPLEADFSSVPYPTSADDHIRAHFAICYSAFLALRVLRWRMNWAFNAADTADALLRMEGVHLQQNYYLFSYRSPATDCIEGSLGVSVAQRIRTRADIKAIPASVRQSFAAAVFSNAGQPNIDTTTRIMNG